MKVLSTKTLGGKRAVVIGAGAAGLAAAAMLAARGARVRVLEQAPVAGGRMAPMMLGGRAFGCGEESIVAPHAMGRLFALADQRVSDFLEFRRLDPAARLVFADGEAMAVRATIEGLCEEVSRFSKEDGAILRRLWPRWESAARAVEERWLAAPGRGMAALASLALVPGAAWPFALSAIDPCSLDTVLRRRFRGARGVRSVFAWLASRCGVSPLRAPASLLLPLAMDFVRGSWVPEGGMPAVRDALLRLASVLDVRITCDARVERIAVENGAVHGVAGEGFSPVRADIVVAAIDARTTLEKLLEPSERVRAAARPLGRRRAGRSAFSVALALKKKPEGLSAFETLLMAENDREHAREIDAWLVPAADPQVHVYDLGAGENGTHALRAVVQQPPLSSRWRWTPAHQEQERAAILAKMARHGIAVAEEDIAEEAVFSPAEFAAAHGLRDGCLFGPWMGRRAEVLARFPNASTAVRGLHHAGGGTHPGPALHHAILSGMAAGEFAE